MQSALQTLGYKSYHMAETANNPGSIVYWLEALKAKYLGQGKPYAKAEFDKLLGNYSVSLLHPIRSPPIVRGVVNAI